MPSAPISSMRCRRRFAYSRGFKNEFLVYLMDRAGHVLGAIAEVLEHELNADPHVFLELGEREPRLFEILLVVGPERRAADLGEIARDLSDGFLGIRAFAGHLQAAETEPRQKAVAPCRERADLRVERLLVARQQRLESHVGFVEHAPRLMLDFAKRLADRR